MMILNEVTVPDSGLKTGIVPVYIKSCWCIRMVSNPQLTIELLLGRVSGLLTKAWVGLQVGLADLGIESRLAPVPVPCFATQFNHIS